MDYGRVHPACPNASNPYHECGLACMEKITDGQRKKDKKNKKNPGLLLENSHSFESKKKGSDSRPASPQAGPTESRQEESKTQPITNSNSTGILLKPNGPKSLPLGSFTCFAITPPETKLYSDRKLDTLESNSKEVNSVISKSRKNRVKANTALTLRSILDKYGDIAENCNLESASLRGHYLECLCRVVQELRSITSFDQLTKPKLKEFLAVVRDVESVHIDASWLRDTLDQLKEAVEINDEQRAAKEAKGNCSDRIKSTKKELEFMMEDLAEKEMAVVEAKVRINKTEARLIELEFESAKLRELISSLSFKVEIFESKPLAQQVL